MNPSLRQHLTRLDRTLVDLFNERARLFAQAGEEAHRLSANVEDLLARSAGPFPAKPLREAFAALDRGCRGEAR
jgi:hypothetical protein